MADTPHNEEESSKEGAVLYGQWDVRFEERAVPTMAMTHIAIQEQLDGKTVDWMEQESSEQYRK